MTAVIFVPKPRTGDAPWEEFGSSKYEYDEWIPHVCGICCLKMIGDTYGVTTDRSLYALTMECYRRGGFERLDDGNIVGVYHYPLLDLAGAYGLRGSVEGALAKRKLGDAIRDGAMAILSVSISVKNRIESHLIVVHAYHLETDEFLVHDCANLLAEDGKNFRIPGHLLEDISNKKGLLIFGLEK